MPALSTGGRPLVLAALCGACAAAVPVSLSETLPLRLLGFGTYLSAPALFLGDPNEGGSPGPVLPIPVPASQVMAVEQAVTGKRNTMVDVLLHGRGLVQRDDGVFDRLPWAWSPNPQAKRDAFSRFTGRGYPRGGYTSPYHMLLDMVRRDCCAEVDRIIIEKANLLGGLVLGGCLLLERRLPQPSDNSGKYAMGAGPRPAQDSRWWKRGESESSADEDLAYEPELCECTTDEALGLALALGCEVLVERRVWEAAAQTASYSLQRGKMRLELRGSAQLDAEDALFESLAAGSGSVPLPWEIKSADELAELPLEIKARSALAAGLSLPRARDATDAALVELLTPFLDETVRYELRVDGAREAGDWAAVSALETGRGKRASLLARLREAVAEEKFGSAAELAAQLRVETERRMDVTQDEGSYDRYLDQVSQR